MRLQRNRSFLLIVDIQSKLAPAIIDAEKIISRTAALVRTARLLGVPVFATEHCPDRIGPTVPGLRMLLDSSEIMAKTQFCCADEPAILARLKSIGRAKAVVTGMEAHVCALQAALGLTEHGFTPCFVRDAAGSRHAADRDAAIARLQTANIPVISAEMAMFEWLGQANDPAFREVLALVKGG
jgi:nicotinamidase-related amidase